MQLYVIFISFIFSGFLHCMDTGNHVASSSGSSNAAVPTAMEVELAQSNGSQVGESRKATEQPDGQPAAKRQKTSASASSYQQTHPMQIEKMDVDAMWQLVKNEIGSDVIERVKDLVNNVDKPEDAPLLVAAIYGKLEVVQKLIQQHGANINAIDVRGNTIMHCAGFSNNLELVEWLWHNVPDELHENRNKDGFTPLIIAVYFGKLAACQKLIQLGANSKATDKKGCTLIHFAGLSGNKKLVKWVWINLPELGEKKDGRGNTVLADFVEWGNIKIAKKLIQLGADIRTVNKFGTTLMHVGILSANVAMIEWLWNTLPLEMRHKPDDHGNTPFMLAAHDGPLAIVQKLKQLDADVHGVNKNGRTAMHHIVFSDNRELVEWIWNNISDAIREKPDEKGFTPLAVAAYYQKLNSVKFLLARVAVVDKRIFEYLSIEKVLDKALKDAEKGVASQQQSAAAMVVDQQEIYIDEDLIRLLIVRGAPVSEKAKQLATAIDPKLVLKMNEWHAEHCACAEDYISIIRNKKTLTQDQYVTTLLPTILPSEGAVAFSPSVNNLMGPLSLVMAYLATASK